MSFEAESNSELTVIVQLEQDKSKAYKEHG
jgi:hypothetical protein